MGPIESFAIASIVVAIFSKLSSSNSNKSKPQNKHPKNNNRVKKYRVNKFGEVYEE